MGAPLPATGLAAAPSAGSSSSSTGSSPGHGFPIWAAVLVLVVVAGVVVLVQRRHRRGALAGAASADPPANRVLTPLEHSVERAEPPAHRSSRSSRHRHHAPPRPQTRTRRRPQDQPALGRSTSVLLAPTTSAGSSSSSWSTWPVTTTGTCASGRSRSAFAPLSSGRPEIAEKTLRNYLSELRQWIGAEHLPESSAKEGYLLHDVDLDWATFLRLSRQADASGGAEAIALRTEALALVRGRPFEGVLDDGFEWVDAEHLDSQMAGAIATCAVAPGHRPPRGQGLRCRRAGGRGRAGAAPPTTTGPGSSAPRRSRAQGDRSALKRWMTDAARHLDAEDIARI